MVLGHELRLVDGSSFSTRLVLCVDQNALLGFLLVCGEMCGFVFGWRENGERKKSLGLNLVF